MLTSTVSGDKTFRSEVVHNPHGRSRLRLAFAVLAQACCIASRAILSTAQLSTAVYTRYSKKRAVERYTASPPPTTPLQSSAALYSLYSFIQRCIIRLYTIQLYSLYSIQRYTITLWRAWPVEVGDADG